MNSLAGVAPSANEMSERFRRFTSRYPKLISSCSAARHQRLPQGGAQFTIISYEGVARRPCVAGAVYLAFRCKRHQTTVVNSLPQGKTMPLLLSRPPSLGPSRYLLQLSAQRRLCERCLATQAHSKNAGPLTTSSGFPPPKTSKSPYGILNDTVHQSRPFKSIHLLCCLPTIENRLWFYTLSLLNS